MIEMLNYSLWFTLSWRVLSVFSTTSYGRNLVKFKTITEEEFFKELEIAKTKI
jgi:hypothetical protein